MLNIEPLSVRFLRLGKPLLTQLPDLLRRSLSSFRCSKNANAGFTVACIFLRFLKFFLQLRDLLKHDIV